MFWSIIFCILVALIIVVGIYFLVIKDEPEVGIPLIVFGIAACLLICLTILFNRVEVKANVFKYEAMQETLDHQRKINAKFENATIALEITKMNKWLASAKYKAKVFNFWYPKEIYDIKPIK